MATFKRILVATDFGGASEAALEVALELAARFDSELTLIHIWEFPNYEYLGGMPMPIDYADRLGEAARRRMLGTVNAIKSRCPNAKSIVKMGIAWSDVLSAEEETKADLLVVGTHGRRGLKRAILGSVAEKLVRLSPVPVLTVHAADKTA
jgi:nucleotide-binding universal stress UspA family protein